MMEPLEFVLSREDVIDEMAKEVVVAKEVVERPAMSVPVFVLVEKRFVDEALVEKMLVVVALEEVELPKTPLPMLKDVAKRLVDEATVEKKLVLVAFPITTRFP